MRKWGLMRPPLMHPPATSIGLPSFNGNRMLIRQPRRWLCSRILKHFITHLLHHILNSSASWKIKGYESMMDRQSNQKARCYCGMDKLDKNIKLKHIDFIENRANYRKFFVFTKAYVFKQGNYWSSVEIRVIMLIYTSTKSDLNRKTGKEKHFLPSPPIPNLSLNVKGSSCKMKADLY